MIKFLLFVGIDFLKEWIICYLLVFFLIIIFKYNDKVILIELNLGLIFVVLVGIWIFNGIMI